MSLWCSEDSAWLDAADLDVADITMELDETVLGSPAAEPFDFSLLDFEPLPACAVTLDSEAAAAAAPAERVMEITPRRKRKRSISSDRSSPDCRSVSSRASTASGPSSRSTPIDSARVELNTSSYLERIRVPHKYCTYHCSDSSLLRKCSEDASVPGYAMFVLKY
jgi:hypothetical protein